MEREREREREREDWARCPQQEARERERAKTKRRGRGLNNMTTLKKNTNTNTERKERMAKKKKRGRGEEEGYDESKWSCCWTNVLYQGPSLASFTPADNRFPNPPASLASSAAAANTTQRERHINTHTLSPLILFLLPNNRNVI